MSTPARVEVIGGGPAGAAAALAALAEGASVRLHEKARFPRHKVCGEFLSPEIEPLLDALGLLPQFQAAGPARITRAVLHLRGREKHFRLPEPAFSLSRAALDGLLLGEALRRGAQLSSERRKPEPRAGEALVLAHGRAAPRRPGSRLFGFKAHFAAADPRAFEEAVELYFFAGGYAGLSPVEQGAVNVCGLAPEEALRAAGFRPEGLLPAALLARLAPLERRFDWLLTGPLVLESEFQSRADAYLAGDALGFVDPFTGSGILSALATGRLAGQAASRGRPFEEYYAQCRRTLRRQYRVAAALRGMLGSGFSESLARWIPGRLLYRLTRPRV
jgi:flavin-dependent dehydrogenase